MFKNRLKIRALFCDYDGTLAPLGVPRIKSRVPVPLANTMRKVHESIPVAIVTAKDYAFIRVRTPFADGWSCVYGIETVLRDGTKRVERPLLELSGAVKVVKKMPNRPRIEYKKTSLGEVCGFCAEWTQKEAPEEEVMTTNISKIRGYGLQVLHDPLYPTFDVIRRFTDKGAAVGVLQKMLGVREGLMFVGDSYADNPAFAVANVGIGVLRDHRQSSLKCDYFVSSKRLNRFLSALVENDLVFSESLPCLRAREVLT